MPCDAGGMHGDPFLRAHDPLRGRCHLCRTRRDGPLGSNGLDDSYGPLRMADLTGKVACALSKVQRDWTMPRPVHDPIGTAHDLRDGCKTSIARQNPTADSGTSTIADGRSCFLVRKTWIHDHRHVWEDRKGQDPTHPTEGVLSKHTHDSPAPVLPRVVETFLEVL